MASESGDSFRLIWGMWCDFAGKKMIWDRFASTKFMSVVRLPMQSPYAEMKSIKIPIIYKRCRLVLVLVNGTVILEPLTHYSKKC